MEILELKNTVTKAKISADSINSRMARTEERVRESEGRTTEVPQSHPERK